MPAKTAARASAKTSTVGKSSVKSGTMFIRDNLEVMRGMAGETVDLIYLDPPFNSNRNWSAPLGSKAAGAHFKDTWRMDDVKEEWIHQIRSRNKALADFIAAAGLANGKKTKAYLVYMAVRLIEMQRILKPRGSIYYHCDPTASHYVKGLMDVIFGAKQFRNEILWCYESGGASERHFSRKHDVLFFYTKSGRYAFNTQRLPHKSVISRSNRHLFNPAGKIMQDWWVDIPFLHQRSAERTGYPTQKPVSLLRRIVAASSREGDVVFDPFCGCATACVAAEQLKRGWIGIDLSALAARLVAERLQDYYDLVDTDGQLAVFRTEVIVRKDIPQDRAAAQAPPEKQKDKKYKEQKGCCNICGYHFPKRNLTRDRIVAGQHGGTYADYNVQLLCNACNSMKGKRSMEWAVAQYKKNLERAARNMSAAG